MEFAVEIGSGAAVGEEFAVGREDLAGFLRGFFKQLDAKMAQAGSVEFFEKSRTGLRGRVEKSVATPHIGSERVLHSHAIT